MPGLRGRLPALRPGRAEGPFPLPATGAAAASAEERLCRASPFPTRARFTSRPLPPRRDGDRAQRSHTPPPPGPSTAEGRSRASPDVGSAGPHRTPHSHLTPLPRRSGSGARLCHVWRGTPPRLAERGRGRVTLRGGRFRAGGGAGSGTGAGAGRREDERRAAQGGAAARAAARGGQRRSGRSRVGVGQGAAQRLRLARQGGAGGAAEAGGGLLSPGGTGAGGWCLAGGPGGAFEGRRRPRRGPARRSRPSQVRVERRRRRPRRACGKEPGEASLELV